MGKNKKKKIAASPDVLPQAVSAPEIPLIQLEAPQRDGFDISRWRMAIKQAEDPQMPDRKLLYDLYNDILLDFHLTAVIGKRIDHVKGTPLVFSDNGKENEEISTLISSPWFDDMIEDLLSARFWGYTSAWLDISDAAFRSYKLLNRKHVVPEKGLYLIKQGDRDGTSFLLPPYNQYFITSGKTDDFGLLIKAVPWVLLKRGDVSDWATFNELFAMPFRKGTYPQFNHEGKKIMEHAMKTSGSAGYALIPQGFDLEFIQNTSSGSTTGYMTLAEFCDKQLSKGFLQSTMTVEAEGGQYKGEVHEHSEKGVHKSDERYILSVLNTKFKELLAIHGFNPGEGKFMYTPENHICLEKRLDMDIKIAGKVVFPAEYWYEKYNIPIPKGGPQYATPESAMPPAEQTQKHREPDQPPTQQQPPVSVFYDPQPRGLLDKMRDFFS